MLTYLDPYLKGWTNLKVLDGFNGERGVDDAKLKTSPSAGSYLKGRVVDIVTQPNDPLPELHLNGWNHCVLPTACSTELQGGLIV